MVEQQNLTNKKYARVFKTKLRSSIERILVDERLLLTLTLLNIPKNVSPSLLLKKNKDTDVSQSSCLWYDLSYKVLVRLFNPQLKNNKWIKTLFLKCNKIGQFMNIVNIRKFLKIVFDRLWKVRRTEN